MKKVTVYSYRVFNALVAGEEYTDQNIEDKDVAIISICCTPKFAERYFGEQNKTDEHAFKEPHPNVLNLDFDDIREEQKETEWGTAYGMTDEQAKQIVDFLDKVKDKQKLLVHCRAGKSRSVAVGMFASKYLKARGVFPNGIMGINAFVFNKLKGYLHE